MATSQILGLDNATVIEGSVAELIQELTKSNAPRGVVIAVPNKKQSMAFLDLVRRISELYPSILEEQEQNALKSIVAALVPNEPVPSSALAQALMNAEARSAVLRSGDFVTASDIAKMAGYSVSNPSSQPIKWKQSRLVFAIQHKGVNYFPLYALNPDDNYRPYGAIGKILRIFGPAISSWAIASWFNSLNSFLDDRRPKDMLAAESDLVIAAAQDQVDELNHV